MDEVLFDKNGVVVEIVGDWVYLRTPAIVHPEYQHQIFGRGLPDNDINREMLLKLADEEVRRAAHK